MATGGCTGVNELWRFARTGWAVYRLARMLTLEEGPLGMWAYVRGHIDPRQETWLGRGLNCPLCVGFWLALFAALFRRGSRREFFLEWWSIAGLATTLQKLER